MRPATGPEELAPIDPLALLEHARNRLAAPEPSESECRRAVSDAFYALYHALTLAAMPHMTANDDPFEPYRRLRGIRHWLVRAAASEARAGTDEQARMVADAMLWLYQWREAADYSHLVRFPRADVETLIRRATRAVEAVAGGGGTALAQRLAALPSTR